MACGKFEKKVRQICAVLSLTATVYKKKEPRNEVNTEAEEDVEEVRDAAQEISADTLTDNPPPAEQQREQPEPPAANPPTEPSFVNTVREEATFELEWSRLSESDDD